MCKSARLSGWTYEHAAGTEAAGLFNERARETLHGFVNDTFQVLFRTRIRSTQGGSLHWTSLMGGSYPSLSESASYDYLSMCAISAAGNVRDKLAPLQIGVGISGGADIPAHALRPDIPDSEVVTVQDDLQNASFRQCNYSVSVTAQQPRIPLLTSSRACCQTVYVRTPATYWAGPKFFWCPKLATQIPSPRSNSAAQLAAAIQMHLRVSYSSAATCSKSRGTCSSADCRQRVRRHGSLAVLYLVGPHIATTVVLRVHKNGMLCRFSTMWLLPFSHL